MSFIELKNVDFIYNEGTEDSVTALKDISLSFGQREFVALVGHNGSGKSTIAKLINGLLSPAAGAVTVDGLSTDERKNHFDIRKNVGVVFQNPDNQMVATIIEDDIAFGPENLGLPPAEIRERVDWALASVGMSDHASGTPYRLSGGQKQRIAIAGVLAIKPNVMILDESTAMLDPVGRREVMEVIRKLNREEGMGVIMITHFMEEAILADRIVVLDKGRVLMDGGREIFEKADIIRGVGLDIPLAASVADKLRRGGMPLRDGIIHPEELVGEICRLL